MAPSARFTEDFAYEVLSVVGEIPEGTVATYGQIARLIGRNKNSRLVARVLSHASDYGEFPCHRVVNHAGRLVPGWPEQAFLLQQEGVELKTRCMWTSGNINGNADLTNFSIFAIISS